MRPTKGVPVKEGVSIQQNTSKRKGKKKKTKHVAALRDEDEVDYTNFEEELYFAVSYHFEITFVKYSFLFCIEKKQHMLPIEPKPLNVSGNY